MWQLPDGMKGFGLTLAAATADHAEGLAENADSELFRYFASFIPEAIDEAGMVRFIEQLRGSGTAPYTILVEGEPVGFTCYLDIRPAHRGIEIGATWIARAYQGTFVNPASKRLMLGHAFEAMECERVQLKCDARNAQSRRAIEKIGAKFEGVLRKHMVVADGFVRDTVMFSVVAAEWPEVREALERRTEIARSKLGG